jgi:hypothetical protein
VNGGTPLTWDFSAKAQVTTGLDYGAEDRQCLALSTEQAANHDGA